MKKHLKKMTALLLAFSMSLGLVFTQGRTVTAYALEEGSASPPTISEQADGGEALPDAESQEHSSDLAETDEDASASELPEGSVTGDDSSFSAVPEGSGSEEEKEVESSAEESPPQESLPEDPSVEESVLEEPAPEESTTEKTRPDELEEAESQPTKPEETESEPAPPEESAPEEELETLAESCGEKLSWTLDEAGTLTVSGEGEMYDFTASIEQPWHAQSDQIQKVQVLNGVTCIGAFSFAECRNLSTLTFGRSVASIHEQAFAQCVTLSSVTIPEKATEIGPKAFYGCSSLEDVVLPDSLSSIGKAAFMDCTSLSHMRLSAETNASISEAVATIPSKTYNGYQQKAEVTVTLDGKTLTEGEDYTLFNDEATNAGTTTVTIKATGSYTGSLTGTFTINRADIAKAEVKVSGKVYNGKAQKPEVSVVLDGVKLTEGTDYTAAKKEYTDAGTYSIGITGTGNYDGAATGQFRIAKADIKPRVTLNGWTYGQSAQNPVVAGNTGKGKETYTYARKGTNYFSAINPTAAGAYSVRASIAESKNYNGAEVSADFTISKANQTVTTSNPSVTVEMGKSVTSLGSGQGIIAYFSASNRIATVTNNGVIKGVSPGKVNITIRAEGNENYNAGTAIVKVKVVCPKPSISKVQNSKAKTMLVKWKKAKGISGYEIQYSLKKNLKNAKTVKVKGAKTTSKTIGSLKKNKTYYVRIRTYYKNTKTVSTWSAVKKVIIKK